jgi:hypothetical protein
MSTEWELLVGPVPLARLKETVPVFEMVILQVRPELFPSTIVVSR